MRDSFFEVPGDIQFEAESRHSFAVSSDQQFTRLPDNPVMVRPADNAAMERPADNPNMEKGSDNPVFEKTADNPVFVRN